MFRKRPLLIAALVIASFAGLSCDDGTEALIGPDATARLEPRTSTLTAVGDSLRMSIVVTNAPRQVANSEVTWSSINQAVATVDAQGIVVATGPGQTGIVASIETIADTAVITVLQTVTGLEIRQEGTFTPIAGPIAVNALRDTTRFKVFARDRRGNEVVTPGAITWASLDPAVAGVTTAGRAFSITNGTARITASSGGVTSSPITLNVQQVAAVVEVTPTARLFTSFGETLRLTGVVRDRLLSVMPGTAIAWQSLTPAVATVAADGTVRAVANGEARVLGTAGTGAEAATITVQQRVARVAVTPTTARLIVGQTVDLSSGVFDANNNAVAATPVTYTSSDVTVATVQNNGRVTSLRAGQATISVSGGGMSVAAVIDVVDPPETVQTVAITPTEVGTTPGRTAQLTAIVTGNRGGRLLDRVISWRTSDPSVATIDQNGLVTAVAEGGAQITAGADGVPGYATIQVTRQVAFVELTPVTFAMLIGDTKQYDVAVKDEFGVAITGKPIVWSVSDPTKATITPTGLVTAVAAGGVEIRAMTEGVLGVSALTITAPAPPPPPPPPPPAAVAVVEVEPNEAIILTGAFLPLTVTTKDALGNVLVGRVVTFSSSDPAIATVSALGVVTGVADGAATITATSEGVTGTAEIQVTPLAPPPPPPPPPIEPPAPGVIFSDNFETGDLTKEGNGYKWLGVHATNVGTRLARSGTHSLEFFFKGKADCLDSTSEQRFVIGGNPRELWMELYVYFPDGTEGFSARYVHRTQSGVCTGGKTVNNNKFFNFWNGNYNTGPKLIVWGELKTRTNLNGDSYLEIPHSRHTGAALNGQDMTPWDPAVSDAPGACMKRGRWNQLRVHVRTSDFPVNNGIVEIWCDGVPRMIELDLNIGSQDAARLTFQYGYLFGWANSGFAADTYMLVDDVAFYHVNPGWTAVPVRAPRQ